MSDLYRNLDENPTRVVCRLLLLPLLLLLIITLVVLVNHLLIIIQVQMRLQSSLNLRRNLEREKDLVAPRRQVTGVERVARSSHNVERSSYRHLTNDHDDDDDDDDDDDNDDDDNDDDDVDDDEKHLLQCALLVSRSSRSTRC